MDKDYADYHLSHLTPVRKPRFRIVLLHRNYHTSEIKVTGMIMRSRPMNSLVKIKTSPTAAQNGCPSSSIVYPHF